MVPSPSSVRKPMTGMQTAPIASTSSSRKVATQSIDPRSNVQAASEVGGVAKSTVSKAPSTASKSTVKREPIFQPVVQALSIGLVISAIIINIIIIDNNNNTTADEDMFLDLDSCVAPSDLRSIDAPPPIPAPIQ